MKLLRSETAASEVVGHMLILFITILGVGMITLYGVPAIYSLEDMAHAKNVEQAFTVLDSRASRVTLGESPLQVTDIDLGGGTMTVVPNSTNNPSYIVIKDQNNMFNVTIPMGKVKYELGDRIVAYEGGGVWAQYPGGGTIMLSPPEFHYDGVTLTLPIININGSASVGGGGTAVVSFKKNATLVQYPNTSRPDWINRTNPINYSRTGKVYVIITSDYYLAWAEYARSLGWTKVNTSDENHSTVIELRVIPSVLGQWTGITNTISFRGLNTSTAPLDNFSFKLEPVVNVFDWDIRVKSGNKKLIFYVTGNTMQGAVDLNIGYEDDGKGFSNPAETWHGTRKLPVQPDGSVNLDLLNESINLTYDSVTVGSTQDTQCYPTKIINSHFNATNFSWIDRKVDDTSSYNQQSLYNITEHYFWEIAPGGDFSFTGCGSQTPDYGTSTMLVYYDPTGAITYLHITNNKADVGIS